MLVLDEAQHLVDYRRNGAYEAADWIKSLMNETSIAFVLIGLKRTENLLLERATATQVLATWH
jgi:DNA transposition AAA+ family ATPase